MNVILLGNKSKKGWEGWGAYEGNTYKELPFPFFFFLGGGGWWGGDVYIKSGL